MWSRPKEKTMKHLASLLTMLLLFVLSLQVGEGWSAPPTSPGQENKIAQAIGSADLAFSHSDYPKAIKILRRSLSAASSSSEVWNRYNRALLAKAGNDYLSTMPKNRYRIESHCLANDLRKGSTDYFLLDIRQPEEFAKGHLSAAINIPLRQVLNHLDRLPKPETGKTLIIICRSQHRANHVLVILRELGYTNALTLRDGYDGYLSWLKSTQSSKTPSGACPERVDGPGSKGENALPVAPSKKIAGIMSEADSVYASNHFHQAGTLLRQALSKFPEYEEIWTKYNRAVLAETGNEYLQGMPENRYRVKVAAFGADYSKGPGLGNYFLLDVRDPDEFVVSHIAGSINIPFRTVLQHIAILPKPDSGKILLIICRSQHRAIHDLVVLRELGYTNAYTLQGGYDAYRTWLKNTSPKQKENEERHGAKLPVPAPNTDTPEDFGC